VDREFYFVQQRCLLPWLWLQRQRQKHRLWLESVFHPLVLASGFSRSVPMATMAMHPMHARPTVIMGRATSITASSWAWAHGPTGAMATAGVTTASPATVEDAILAVTVEGAIQAAAVVPYVASEQHVAVVVEQYVVSAQHAAAAEQHVAAAAQQYVAAAAQHAAAAVVEHVAAAAVDIASRLDAA